MIKPTALQIIALVNEWQRMKKITGWEEEKAADLLVLMTLDLVDEMNPPADVEGHPI